MSLISLCWTLFKSPGLWDKFVWDCIFGKGDQLFKFIRTFRYLDIEELLQEFSKEYSLLNEELLEIKIGEITTGAYLLSIAEVVNSVQQIVTGPLLIFNDYTLSLMWENDSIYLFDYHINDVNGKLSSPGTFDQFIAMLTRKNFTFKYNL